MLGRLLHSSLSVLAVCTLLFWTSSTCSAQVRRYQPRTPTISPYNNLTRPNRGSLPNYYALVRPEFNQRAFNEREMALRQQQAGALQQLTNQVQRGLQPAGQTGKNSWFMNPGSQSRFLDSSRYYGNAATGGVGFRR